MRTFLLVAFLAVSALAVPAPVPAPRVDYPAVKVLVQELRTKASEAIQAIKNAANNDNPQVGQTISAELDKASTAALLVLAEAEGLIDAETLTLAKAQELLQGLLEDIEALRVELADDIAQLTEAAQNAIAAILVAALAEGQVIADKIYAALGSLPREVDWENVKSLVQELRNKATEAITAIKAAAITDNTTVGQTIAEKLDVASAAALVVLADAEKLIAEQTLTEAKAKELLQGLLEDIEALRVQLADDIAQLTQAAQTAIAAILVAALAEGQRIADLIYAALA